MTAFSAVLLAGLVLLALAAAMDLVQGARWPRLGSGVISRGGGGGASGRWWYRPMPSG
jgi:hypothetical protein